MSDLEQAEARLVEAREEAWDASRRLLAAAIEVGRLRALAEVGEVGERLYQVLLAGEFYADHDASTALLGEFRAALAAREEASE